MTLRPTYAHRSSRVTNSCELARYQSTVTYREASRRKARRLFRLIASVWLIGIVVLSAIYLASLISSAWLIGVVILTALYLASLIA